jgi:hypothetical protein
VLLLLPHRRFVKTLAGRWKDRRGRAAMGGGHDDKASTHQYVKSSALDSRSVDSTATSTGTAKLLGGTSRTISLSLVMLTSPN